MSQVLSTQSNFVRYNGWTNYATWNVVLWIGSDEGLYNLTRHCECYDQVLEIFFELGIGYTPDGVRYCSSDINRDEIDEKYFERV